MPTILGLGGGRYFCAKYPAKSTASIDVPVKKREQLGWLKLPINDKKAFKISPQNLGHRDF